MYDFNDMEVISKVTYILLRSKSDRYRVICISDNGYAYFSLDSRFDNVHFTDGENVKLFYMISQSTEDIGFLWIPIHLVQNLVKE